MHMNFDMLLWMEGDGEADGIYCKPAVLPIR